MFTKEKQSTTAKIGVISTAWTMLVIAMVATTFSLYEQKSDQQGPNLTQFTSSSQYTNYY